MASVKQYPLTSVLNYYAYKLKINDLIIVSNLTLKTSYSMNVPSDGYRVGIVIEEKSCEEVKDFSEKLYKVLICDKIILLKLKDIQEKLT